MSGDGGTTRTPVAVLGATGLVGQRLVALLSKHPWFELVEVAASARSAGRPYAEAVRWQLPGPVPAAAADLAVLPVDPRDVRAPLVFSALDAGVAAVHGPVVTQMAQTDPKDLDHLWRLLEDPRYRPTYQGRPAKEPHETPLAAPCGKTAAPAPTAPVEGRLWGGNLTMLSAKSGWSSPPSEPTIALFEDLAEAPYRLDRMITQLHLSGHLAAVEAAALGTFLPPAAPTTRPASRPPDDPPQTGRSKQDLARKVACRLAELNIPSVLDMPWGHVGKNLAVALGVQARLDLEEATLTCVEGLVSRRPS